MPQQNRDIIVMGASAGGVQALQRLVSALPADLPAAIFIVLHIWPGTKSYLPAILQRAGQLRVLEGRDGAPIEPGTITVAPPDMHLMLERDHTVVVRGPRENRARPAVNPLFRSAAAAFRNRTIGVILTGTLDDGAAGLWAIKQCGGVAVVQSDAVFDQMPRSALESVEVDHPTPLDNIAPLLNRLSRESVGPTTLASVPDVVVLNNQGSQMKPAGFDVDSVGKRSLFTCPECSGALWEVEEGVLQFRCHVGHAYSPAGLTDAQNINIEQSLWGALRALKESAALDDRLAARADEHKLERAAQQYRESASGKMEQVAHLQQFLAGLQHEKSRPDLDLTG
jgi:two-component system, chemotaxis family, protein-glutamate methylesterase/glutaminase